MSHVEFPTVDRYGHFIQSPVQPLGHVLWDRLEGLKDAHNMHVAIMTDKTTKLEEGMDVNKAVSTELTSSVDTLYSSVDNINEALNDIWENLDLLQLRAIDAISAEERHRILKMKASPDEENHVMAKEIIKSKLTEAGLLSE